MGTRLRALPAVSNIQENCDLEEYNFEDIIDTYSTPIDTKIYNGENFLSTNGYVRPNGVATSSKLGHSYATKYSINDDENVNSDNELYTKPTAINKNWLIHKNNQNSNSKCNGDVKINGHIPIDIPSLTSNSTPKETKPSQKARINGSTSTQFDPTLASLNLKKNLPDRKSGSETSQLKRLTSDWVHKDEDKSPLNEVSTSSEVANIQGSPCIYHDDTKDIISTGHKHSNKRCEQRIRAREFGIAMGDLESADVANVSAGMGAPNVGRRTRRGALGHHQPPFPKALSIIETLSELAAAGPEVRKLAQEQRPRPLRSSSGPKTGRAHSGSRLTRSTTASGSSDEAVHPPGPPVVSPDFQQYTEKIYDAVTSVRKSNTATTSKSTNRGKSIVQQLSRKSDHNPHKDELRAEDVTDTPEGEPKKTRERSFQLQHHRGRERGRTPDWIKRIFDIAKKGDLPSLKRNVMDMEGTLIRNLSDHAGNNLLHVLAVLGHLAPLSWLLTSQPVLIDALYDENKFGLTPLVCAIKYGRLRLVQWLVENTTVREKIRCKEGERTLLHIGAKYEQEEIVAWLVDYMMSHEIPLDNKDHHGNTAIHLAARTGNSRVCSILLQHGADVTLKNDLGQKAWEVCMVRGHLACAEYLCVHETGLALATDLTRREAELEAATADNHDLKINFKEVLSIARRLLKEREEVVRELSRLDEHMAESHDNILMGLQVLVEPNSPIQEQVVNGIAQTQHARREQVESLMGYVTGVRDRMQGTQKKALRNWTKSSFVDMKHRMLLVEEAWKKLKHRSHRTVATTHHPLDVFRGKLCGVRAQGGEGRLGDLPSLCSSEESITSLFPFTDEEELYEGVEDYEITSPHASSTPARSTDQNLLTDVEIHAETLPARLSKPKDNKSKSAENIASETLPPRPRPEIADYLSCNETFDDDKDFEDSIDSKHNQTKSQNSSHYLRNSSNILDTPSKPYWTDPSLSASLSILTDISNGEKLPKEEVNARLRELALTSESGSCSVLEVIEPSSEESDVHMDDEFELENFGIGIVSSSRENDDNQQNRMRVMNERRIKRQGRNRNEESDGNNRGETVTTSSESGADGILAGDQPDLSSDSKHFLVNETSMGTAASDVSDTGQRSQRNVGSHELSVVTSLKRKGFLHKFSLKPRWPSKRKVKTPRKIELSIREFQETYSTNHRATERSLSLGDTDPHTTPESNTSSSQEYSNSSEESSIGKPTTSLSRNNKQPPPVPNTSPPKLFESDVRIRTNFQHQVENESRPEIQLRVRPVSYPRVNSPSRSPTPPPIPSRRVVTSPTPQDIESISSNNGRYSEGNDTVDGNAIEVSSVTKTSVGEVRSVAASEDSGIVARPASSASKSDSVSRPESSTSSFPPFKSDYHLQKSNLSLTHDHLPTLDSSAGRMSPAPSEVSKTESALSPPSHASDVSKSESARQLSVGKGSLGGSTNSSNSSKEGSSSDYSLTLLPLKKDHTVKTAAIISCDNKSTKNDPISLERNENIKKEARPWYELSDEESDILLPDRLTSKVVSRHSSSEDEEAQVC